jgi:hypothetical protein
MTTLMKLRCCAVNRRVFLRSGGLLVCGKMWAIDVHGSEKKLKLPLPTENLKVDLSKPTATGDFQQSPVEMRLVATRTLDSLKSISAQYTLSKKQLAVMQDALEVARTSLADLHSERDLVLQQLRQGLFCSKCMRSKIEIEMTGVSFENHLSEVNGVRLSASPQEIEKKEREYSQRIRKLTDDISVRSQNIKKLNVYFENLNSQFAEGTALWSKAIEAEKLIIQINFDEKSKKIRRNMDNSSKELSQLAELEKSLSKDIGSSSTERAYKKKTLNLARKELFEERARLASQYDNLKSSYDEDAKQAREYANSDYKAIAKSAAEFDDRPIPLNALPSFNLSIGAGTMDVGTNRLGMSFGFNSVVSAGFEAAFDPSEFSQESKAFFAVFEKVRLYASYSTKSDYWGTSENYSGGLELTGPSEEDLWQQEIKIEPPVINGTKKLVLPKP